MEERTDTERLAWLHDCRYQQAMQVKLCAENVALADDGEKANAFRYAIDAAMDENEQG